MLSVRTRYFWFPILSSCSRPSASLKSFSSKRWDSEHDPRPGEEELEAARQWLDSLSSKSIPRNIGKISYSTSSGPGGQNVNKSNTKATLAVSLTALLPLVPNVLHDYIRSSRYFAKSSDSLVIQSQESRNRTANQNRCYEKLWEMLSNAGEETIPGRTSTEQQEKVKRLQAAEKETRMRLKKKQSQKKQARRPKSFDD